MSTELKVQSDVFENIKRLYSNYKKDGPSRKTSDYLTEKLIHLENQWADFDGRNNILMQSEDKSHEYFTEKVYIRTKQMYEELKQDILSRLQSAALPKTTTVHNPSPTEETRNAAGLSQTTASANETVTNNHLAKLISIQNRNFRAIHRAMAKVDIKNLSEKWELEEQLSILRSKWTDIDKLHWELDGECNDPSYYRDFEEIEKRYDSLKREINNKLSSSLHYQQSAPKIDVPVFSGDYSQWISFKDLFLETVDKNPSLSKVQKMQHLKSKLRGEAENLVRHLHINSDNYESCWDILTQRYDNRRLVFTSYVNTMLNIPSIQQANANNLKNLHDVITECLNGLHNIGIDTESWGPMIAHLMAQKLDTTTYSEYTKELQNPRDIPSVDEFTSFLESKFMALETLRNRQKDSTVGASMGSQQKPTVANNTPTYKSAFKPKRFNFAKTYHVMFGQCPLCNKSHVLMQCRKFIKMNSADRNATFAKLNAQGSKLCKNCLYSHGNEECPSQKTCRECSQQHHTLLHNETKKSTPKDNKYLAGSSSPNAQNLTTNHAFFNKLEILLTTTLVQVKASNGTYVMLRALLDQGSQANLISESAAQLLNLSRRKVTATVSGVGSISGDCRGCLHLECKSINSDYIFNTDVLVMKQLTNPLPNKTFERPNWEHLANLKLADPEFNVSRGIDLLLGADVYSNIIMSGVLKGDAKSPTAQQTRLGWILCGNAGNIETLRCHVTLTDLSEISRFWETEDILSNNQDITNEDFCEKYYQETTRRAADGKYIVKMPMLPNFEENMGKSKNIAISQFLQLERRLSKNGLLASRYNDFINEYKNLGHMTVASKDEKGCFLPHHGVLREQSSTTKLRVVFNGSQKTSTGYSLNDLMHKGPNLQKDIQALLIKWRSYKYVFTADIEKHYRSIWLSEDQHHLQKIIWRGPDNKLQEMSLRTVTYGTKCAPWLAMRTLKQLAIDDGHKYPEAAEVLKHHFYVDDLISGHHSLQDAKTIKDDLIALLCGGGMNLRKWSSNNASILENLSEDQISTNKTVDFKTEDTARTLGLSWSPQTDTFRINWDTETETRRNLTKSELLSQISKLYDPLGWFAPVTVAAKLLFQQVWGEKSLTWGDTLSQEIQAQWDKIKAELVLLKDIKLNRWIGTTTDHAELHGFCDASEKAYSCVIYNVVKGSNGQQSATLIAAKTRVTPLSEKISLPRLELCGALLLSQLIDKTTKSLKDSTKHITVYLWCDSKVVLAWLQGGPSKWEKYVANRVGKILQVAPANNWRYVKSEDNPADCASRGLPPRKLVDFDLWWQGPPFLQTYSEKQKPGSYATTLEENITTNTYVARQDIGTGSVIGTLLENCSAYTRALRVIAWVFRFVSRLRGKQPETTYLSATELNQSADRLVKYAQQIQFEEEIKQLRKDKTVSAKSKIFKLLPYLDESGILRVGGRLKHSNLPLNMKNPIILPHTGKLTQLVVEHAHAMTLHGGARLTLAHIRQNYWIISGNRAVKTLLRRCVRCHRYNLTEHHQLMGNLPQPRVTPSRPFTHTGIDYTGHVDVKSNKGRGVRTSKGYVVIFICLATKAVHIELASDLSTNTFLAAFERLCARRGTPKHVYTDNGTNFVGAARVLRSEFEHFQQLLTVDFFNNISKMGITWHFSVPTWASANGIWEAAVKSMKHHLRRVLGDQKLTFEEFTTLLSKIEACLNSRYLCPLTEDPDEFYNGLTPAHFLTGGPTMLVPEGDYNEDTRIDLRKRWQLVKHMSHQFWKNWSSEYLQQLQVRCKWNKPTRNLQEGDVVLVKEDNLPPGKWALARVTQLHPGSDGHVRVATLKTQTKTMKRPVTKLAPLPTNKDEKRSFHLQLQADKRENTTTAQAPGTSTAAKTVKKMSTCGFFNLVLLTLFLLSNTTAVDSKQATTATHITNLGRERPIYYDSQGQIALMQDEWILVMYYNLTSYWEGTEQMQSYLKHLKDVCNRMEPVYCATTLTQLNHEMSLLNYYNDILLEPSKHLSRKKRGLIDGVGYVANSLFGILDQHFATKYESDIQAIQENEGHLLSLIKNQTSIVQLENEALKRNEDNIYRQFQAINDTLQQVNASLNKTQTLIEATMAIGYFSTSSVAASLLLNNLKTVQELLFNTLTDIYKGRIDIHLLTPANLINQLEIISGQLPRTLTLPVDNIRKEIKDVYKLLYVRGRITDGFFLFEVHIPLLCDDTFKLYRNIPLPIQTQADNAKWVETSAEYIAINFRKNTYLSMTQRNIDQCTRQSADSLICHAILPIRNLRDGYRTPCEAKLIGQHAPMPCALRKAPCADDWIELHTTNTWLAICCGECTARTLCDNELILHTLQGSSIVTLARGCVLQTDSLIIYSQNKHSSNLTMDPGFISPTVVFNTSINAIVSAKLRGGSTQLYEPDRTHLAEIDARLRSQSESENKSLAKTSIDDRVHYVVIYSLFGAVALIALIVWVARTRDCGRGGARAQRRPTTTTTNDMEMQEVPVKGRDKGTDNVSFSFE